MKLAGIFLIAGLTACTSASITNPTPVINPALVQDGQLLVAAFQTLNAGAQADGASPADTVLIAQGLATTQSALAALQGNLKTPQDYVTLITNEVNAVAPTIEKDLKDNATTVIGVQLVLNFLPLLVQDLSAPAAKATPAGTVDQRTALNNWVRGKK